MRFEDKLEKTNGVFYTVDYDGSIKKYQTLFLLSSETGKIIVVYTDYTYDEDDGLEVHASIYSECVEEFKMTDKLISFTDGDDVWRKGKLELIEKDEDWNAVEVSLEKLQNGELEEDE